MESRRAPYLFTESRLSIEATSPASTLHIPTGTQAAAFANRTSRGHEGTASHDEHDFARKHIAIESSIFFRHKNRSPRNILWRVLDEGKTLALQAVDLTQDRKSTQESLLTFSISFDNPIRKKCVALADSSAHDALEVFVITTANELFTFSLRRSVLLLSTVPSPADFDPHSCYKTYRLASFSINHPYKLTALSDTSLAVALPSGQLLRLERRAGSTSGEWHESYFGDGTSVFQSILGWKGQNTLRFDGMDLTPATAAAVQSSPSGEHVFVVSLDHTLKAWNTATGKVGFQIDLMGEPMPEGRPPNHHLIGPDQDSLMKIVDFERKPDGDSFYCVVYSPKDHKFKFWAVRDPDSAEHGLRDVYPDLNLVPPIDELMDTKLWHLADFDIAPGVDGRQTTLWIRARSGAQCNIFKITFDLLDTASSMSVTWSDSWEAVDEGFLSTHRLSKSSDLQMLSGDEDVDLSASLIDEWLDFLTFPGRFTPATLETSLHIYCNGQGLGAAAMSTALNASFQERIRSAITAKIGLVRTQDGNVDTTRYANATAVQCKIFYGVVELLHERRGESLALALDRDSGLCWSVRADQISPIRGCSDLEIYSLNGHIFRSMDEKSIENLTPFANLPSERLDVGAATLSFAAKDFRAGLSPQCNKKLERLSSALALQKDNADITDGTRRTRRSQITPLKQLYEQCHFADDVDDAGFDDLTDSVQALGGLGRIENGVFRALLGRLTEACRDHDKGLALTHYGAMTTIRVAQETIIDGRETLLDLLALLIFMSQDLEPSELAPGFKAMELYEEITLALKSFNVLLWMASNTRIENGKRRKTSAGHSMSNTTSKDTTGPCLTIMESVFIGDWNSMSNHDEPLSSLITSWSRTWSFGSDLGVEYDGVTAHVMSNLIKEGDYRLASDFAGFLPSNAWTTYLRGRMFMGEGDYSAAAACFKRAASSLSESPNKSLDPIDVVDTATLLSAVERRHFDDGLPRYYLHCSALFEQSQLPAFAADLAAAALHSLDGQLKETPDSSMMEIDSRKESMLDSPVDMRVDLGLEEIQVLKTRELREEICSRLFNASLQTQRYRVAFEAMTKFKKPSMTRASLSQLLTSILSTSPSLLVTLPFPDNLVPEVDHALHNLARDKDNNTDDTPPYDGILYSWRIAHDNYRGAAEILHERLQALKAEDPDADELLDTYLLFINSLACCGPNEGWILAEDEGRPRRIVTLEQARTAYQAELDRRSEMAHGRFALFSGSGGAMDVDVF